MGGKLEKLWSGPYTIHKDLGKGRYSLETLEGKQMKQAINCARLKRYLDPPVEDQMLPTDDNAEDGRDYGINDTCHSASNSVGEEDITKQKMIVSTSTRIMKNKRKKA